MIYVFDNRLKYKIGDNIKIRTSAIDTKDKVKINDILKYCDDGFFRKDKNGDFKVIMIAYKRYKLLKRRIVNYQVECIK